MTAGTPLASAMAAEVALSEFDEFIDHALSTRFETALAMIAVPAPAVPLERVLELGRGAVAFLWDPPHGDSVVGLGSAQVVSARGRERFSEVRSRGSKVLSEVTLVRHPDCDQTIRPLLAGGLSFDVGAADAPPWSEFGDATFVLPRFSYRSDGRTASLALTVAERESSEESWPQGVRELLSRLGEIAAEGDDLELYRQPEVVQIERPSSADWNLQVEAIRAAIASGRFQKIVAARCSRVRFREPLQIASVLRRLTHGLRDSIRFAFCNQRDAFFGATPERLIQCRGRRLETEALAGSLASDENPNDLLDSAKNLEEHRLVVEEIVARLTPLCEHLEASENPRIRELEDVIHLHTPIAGVLRSPIHVIDLVARLHPTPAVGGTPTGDAMSWIAEHESCPRGWYASPIGWFDSNGDGEFAVALRSCLASNLEALVYAGAGIVESSDPCQEFLEVGLKEQALLKVLGRS